MFQEEQKQIEQQIYSIFKENSIPFAEDMGWAPVPFSGEWGISTSFFKIAALEAKSGKSLNVPQRAEEIARLVAENLPPQEYFSRIEAAGGYLNLYFDSRLFSARVVNSVLSADHFGKGDPKGKTLMVEFSQPNTHKAFHVGHLRSAILGDAVCRILEFAGYDVIRANFYGDMGLHVIKWLWNYQKFHSGETPPADATRWMGDLYAEANRRLEENPGLESEVRELYGRWDRQEPEIVDLWKQTRQWSVDGFHDLYEVLDINFDRIYANSEVEFQGKELVDELIKKGIAEDLRPDDAVIVRLDDLLGLKKEKYRVLVVLRSDGTALYATEDLALAKLKFEEYPLDKSIYVVDVRQSLHFQQVWKTLEIAGYSWAENLVHLSYELVNLPGNVVMASREGTVVLLEDLIREAKSRAFEVVDEKNPDLNQEDKMEIARAVGLGAIKFPMLDRENTRIVTFDWETALDFNGQAAPYIQYAHVRANSILKKADGLPSAAIDPDYELDPTEVSLIENLSQFPAVIQNAAREYKPLHLTHALFEVARSFNAFYRQAPVLNADPEVRDFRLQLVEASRIVLSAGLNLLGIEAPKVM
ncbi:MAG: arginine--tRNA ligase [Anaerolineales bacterium]|nr:arginine--tRNA ligase [Anaerolineales bacterium]